ncbi:NapC/NirT family cytochrome c [Thiolapillus sp.]|uniref:NapC/NirT family cytochrome c n=1 Tax=Thiolapillus sp. TaxID=2017437 RepID=UPI003AF6366A
MNKHTKHYAIPLSIALLIMGLFSTSSVWAEKLKALKKCESCHVEQAEDYHTSAHYINRSGVQAVCNNCHKGYRHRKGKRTSKHVTTPRMKMALNEWKRECKSCHSDLAMDLSKQEPRSVERHEKSFENGETSCIKCHKGISHQLPHGWKEVAIKAGLQK